MLNNFQTTMINPNKRHVCWEIIKVFHPEIEDKKQSWFKVTTHYEWIVLQINKSVSIGIQFECKLSSGSKPLELFEKELQNNKFKAWRFCLDSKFNNTEDTVLLNEKVNKILNTNNIAKPTAKQMYDYYHAD
jgi:hypothetical protein